MKRYYQPEIETASPEQMRAWQDERLVKQVRHVWDNVPYYRKKMEEKGVTVYLVRNDIIPISSTQMRRLLAFRCAGEFLLSLRPAGQAPGRLRPHPVHLRHHRQAGGGLLHPA